MPAPATDLLTVGVFLNRIGTAVPAHDVHRVFVRFAETLLTDRRDRALFDRMVARSGIEHRWSTLAPAADPAGGGSIDRDGFYARGRFPGSGARMRRYETAALPLARAAVERLALDPRELATVTHLIVATCTGFYAPGLDLDLARTLGLADTVERTVVGFMGCQAAFNALKLARHVVRAEPDARVLVVTLELCTLHLQERASLEQVLSFLVFADGAAAALVSAEPVGLALDRFRTDTIPAGAELITWRIGDQGFDMFLSGQVPTAIGTALRVHAATILDGAAPTDLALWAVHPGGRSVLDAVENAFALPPTALDRSRAVLRDHGNMSSATIMFVLAAVLASAPTPGTSGCALAFGPGLTAESLLFHAA